jgi:hypothetical protein
MSVSKRTLLVAAAGAAAGMSIVERARAQASGAGQSKSMWLTKLNDGEVVKINLKTGNIQKSASTVSDARHQAALAKGAKEVSGDAIVYKRAGKMYMFDYQAAANTQAAENFQDQFDEDY